MRTCASWKELKIGSTRKTWLATMRSKPSAPSDSGSSNTRMSGFTLKDSIPPTVPKSLARDEQSTKLIPFARKAQLTMSSIYSNAEYSGLRDTYIQY